MATRPEDRAYVELGTTFSRGAVGAPVSGTQTEILWMLFNPDEAHCAASLDYVPEPEEIIAARAGVAPDVAADLLTRMASRGLIRGVREPDGVRVFRLPLFFPGLFEMVSSNPVKSRREVAHEDPQDPVSGVSLQRLNCSWHARRKCWEPRGDR